MWLPAYRHLALSGVDHPATPGHLRTESGPNCLLYCNTVTYTHTLYKGLHVASCINVKYCNILPPSLSNLRIRHKKWKRLYQLTLTLMLLLDSTYVCITYVEFYNILIMLVAQITTDIIFFSVISWGPHMTQRPLNSPLQLLPSFQRKSLMLRTSAAYKATIYVLQHQLLNKITFKSAQWSFFEVCA